MNASIIYTLLSSSLLMLLVLLVGLAIKSVRHDRYWPMVVFLFCLGVQLLQTVWSMGEFYRDYPQLLHAGTWLLFANGPATWLMLGDRPLSQRVNVWWHFLPCLLAFIWLLTFYQLPDESKPMAYYGVGTHKMTFWLLFLLHWGIYLLVAVKEHFAVKNKPSQLFSLVVGLCAIYLVCSMTTWLGLVVWDSYWRFWDMASVLALALLVAGLTLLHVTRTGHLIRPSSRSKLPVEDFTLPLNALVRDQSIFQQPELTLQGLANQLNCSSRELSSWFNQSLNIGFKRWLNEQRIKEAKRLIRQQPDQQVSTVGYDVGFNSSATFYRAFKQITGVSPGQYKNQYQSSNRGVMR